jgi:hypothetical protein
MMERTQGTLDRASKGPIAPPPTFKGIMAEVAETVSKWPGVISTAHWDLYDSSRIDGIDFYVGEDELGHIHLDGSIHLATSPSLGKSLIAEGLARQFPYGLGWVQAKVERIGSTAAVALFARNYKRFVRE